MNFGKIQNPSWKTFEKKQTDTVMSLELTKLACMVGRMGVGLDFLAEIELKNFKNSIYYKA